MTHQIGPPWRSQIICREWSDRGAYRVVAARRALVVAATTFDLQGVDDDASRIAAALDRPGEQCHGDSRLLSCRRHDARRRRACAAPSSAGNATARAIQGDQKYSIVMSPAVAAWL